MDAIEIQDLTRSFGGIRAVDSLTLNVRQGELFALLGVNGAGKSTTIKMLSGVLRPDGGDARVMGASITTSFGRSSPSSTSRPRRRPWRQISAPGKIFGS